MNKSGLFLMAVFSLAATVLHAGENHQVLEINNFDPTIKTYDKDGNLIAIDKTSTIPPGTKRPVNVGRVNSTGETTFIDADGKPFAQCAQYTIFHWSKAEDEASNWKAEPADESKFPASIPRPIWKHTNIVTGAVRYVSNGNILAVTP